MAESIIGTIVISVSPKRFLALYHLSFTDQRVFAVEGSAVTSKAMFPQIGGAAGTVISGLMSSGIGIGLGSGGMRNMERNMAENAREMRLIEGQRQWVQIKQTMGNKSVIDYDTKEVTAEMQNLPSISIPYDKIKEVKFKKTFTSSDYEIIFQMGILSSETFLVADSEVEPIRALLAKTPLAQKLKE